MNAKESGDSISKLVSRISENLDRVSRISKCFPHAIKSELEKSKEGDVMSKTMKQQLRECFKQANEEKSQFIAVSVRVEGAPEPEVIINRIENAFAKLSYYLKAYDDDLRLVHNRNIQIIGFTHANSYDEIQADLVD